MSAEFTPGPWRLAQMFVEHGLTLNDGAVPILSGGDEETAHVALVALRIRAKRGATYKATDPERDANAHLIAAAPDMYAALEAFNIKEHAIVGGTADSLVLRVPISAIRQAAAALAKAKGESAQPSPKQAYRDDVEGTATEPGAPE